MVGLCFKSLRGCAIGNRCGFPSLGGCNIHSDCFVVGQPFLGSNFAKLLLQANDFGDGDLGRLALTLKLILDKLDEKT